MNCLQPAAIDIFNSNSSMRWIDRSIDMKVLNFYSIMSMLEEDISDSDAVEIEKDAQVK